MQGAVLGHLVARHQTLLQGRLCWFLKGWGCGGGGVGGGRGVGISFFYLILMAGVDVGDVPQPQET